MLKNGVWRLFDKSNYSFYQGLIFYRYFFLLKVAANLGRYATKKTRIFDVAHTDRQIISKFNKHETEF